MAEALIMRRGGGNGEPTHIKYSLKVSGGNTAYVCDLDEDCYIYADVDHNYSTTVRYRQILSEYRNKVITDLVRYYADGVVLTVTDGKLHLTVSGIGGTNLQCTVIVMK